MVTSGLSRLMVGGTMPSRIAKQAEDRFHRARRAQQDGRWRIWSRTCGLARRGIAQQPLHRAQFDAVGHGRGAMGVDIVDVGGGKAGPLQRHLHGAIAAIAVFGRRGDVDRRRRTGHSPSLRHRSWRRAPWHAPVPPASPRRRPRPSQSRRGPCRRAATPWCGVSLKAVDSARQALKPAMPMRQMAASAPPASITSASSSAISRAASPMAWAPVAQAVTTA